MLDTHCLEHRCLLPKQCFCKYSLQKQCFCKYFLQKQKWTLPLILQFVIWAVEQNRVGGKDGTPFLASATLIPRRARAKPTCHQLPKLARGKPYCQVILQDLMLQGCGIKWYLLVSAKCAPPKHGFVGLEMQKAG